MTTTDEQYVPSEDELREAYVWLSAGYNEGARETATEDFNRGMARVRRESIGEVIQELQRAGMTDASSYLIWYRDGRFHE